MVAIARRLALALLTLFASPLLADRAADVRAQITAVATSLASSDPSAALAPFDKSRPEYDKLARYFEALTNSFEVVSEIELVDENDTEAETVVKANWTLQVSDRASAYNVRRSYETTLHLKPIAGKWKIVSFAPVEMFNPQGASVK